MNPMQREYFRRKLHHWRAELVQESEATRDHLQNEVVPRSDVLDRASAESDRSLELRTRDRYRKLINKIDAALLRITNETYGYCEISGQPIGIRRLDARPIATMTVEAQTQHERAERTQNMD
ncbi:MAG: RNA polymerase-binding protein DksA [Pseudomonadota bacterium]